MPLLRRGAGLICASLGALAVVTGPAGPGPAAAAQPRMIQGGVGLIDMPSARFADEGELSATINFFENTEHYSLGFQVLPWLETSFRYSGLAHFDPSYSIYYDRSFAMKMRLLQESVFFPSVAVGINDLVGTGVYSGEYVVASKSIGDLDFTIGMGWGRLGSSGLLRNPLTRISNSFETRPGLTTPGGTNFGTFFHGPTSGVFGGLVWATPVKNLSLIAEYSSDTYALEKTRGNFNTKSQVNLGASYQIFEGVTLGVQWLYGHAISGTLSFQFNPAKPQFPVTLRPPAPTPSIRTVSEQQQALETLLHERSNPRGTKAVPALPSQGGHSTDFVEALFARNEISDVQISGGALRLTTTRPSLSRCAEYAALSNRYDLGVNSIQITSDAEPSRNFQCAVPSFRPVEITQIAEDEQLAVFPANSAAAEQAIRKAATAQHILIDAISLTASEALIYYRNTHYFSESQAIDRLIKLLAANTPAHIEKFRLIATETGMQIREFDVLRGPLERALDADTNLSITRSLVQSITAPMANPVFEGAAHYPNFTWGIAPLLRQSLFDPANPVALHVTANLDGNLELWRGLSLRGTFEATIFENFRRNPSNSVLPHVRSDFADYVFEGKNGIASLQMDYHFRLSPTVYAVAKAGYLESMFAGAGGEILWRPEGARWALGGDFYHVQQRAFDRLLGLRSYKANTGHVSLYYESPWYDLNFAVRAGQYLAGDRGVTFEVTRRFATGIEIGAFMTKTNVSSAAFGEGSFDKGIIIRIPLSWATPIETQSVFAMDLRPIQRDGGQRLIGDTTLYVDTRRSSIAELDRQTR